MTTSHTVNDRHVLTEDDVPVFLDPAGSSRAPSRTINNLDWRQALGLALAAAGILLLLLGWYGVSGTRDTAQQLAYFISGGLIGTGLLGSGIAMLIAYEHVADRATLERLLDRIDRLEYGIATEFDELRHELAPSRPASVPGARRTR